MARVPFKRRILLFAIGAGMGIILSIIFFRDRGAVITGWLPGARVLKRLRMTDKQVSRKAQCQIDCLSISQWRIDSLLSRGDVDFGRSHPRSNPKDYIVENSNDTGDLTLRFTVKGDSTWISEILTPNTARCSCP